MAHKQLTWEIYNPSSLEYFLLYGTFNGGSETLHE